MSDRQKEIDQNLEYFLRELAHLPESQQGKFALIRHQKIEGYYDTAFDAVKAGNALYHDKLFSIQQVTRNAVNLGYFSHAVPLGTAQ